MLRRVLSHALCASVALGWAAVGCNTYTTDLDRSIKHYDANQYIDAVALLEVLERDFDSLSTVQQTQYAYFRGMAHFRLNHRSDARHWLGFAAAAEKKNPGGLNADEQKRVTETLDGLNKAVYGIAEGTSSKAKSCKSDTDCDKGSACSDGACKAGKPDEQPGTPSAEPAAPGKGDAPTCTRDKDCAGADVCKDGRCQKP
ncbi:MAG: hypothetical protein IT373_29720 [Polyangiaceae bacterium]|nr:hypothetical protein [Polyangiaceae bacterium]